MRSLRNTHGMNVNIVKGGRAGPKRKADLWPRAGAYSLAWTPIPLLVRTFFPSLSFFHPSLLFSVAVRDSGRVVVCITNHLGVGGKCQPQPCKFPNHIATGQPPRIPSTILQHKPLPSLLTASLPSAGTHPLSSPPTAHPLLLLKFPLSNQHPEELTLPRP